MASQRYERVARTSSDSVRSGIDIPTSTGPSHERHTIIRAPVGLLRSLLWPVRRVLSGRFARRHRWLGLGLAAAALFFEVSLVLVVLTSILYPSYTHRPAHYAALEHSVNSLEGPGRGNPRGETVFIATSLYDPHGKLLDGQWGDAVLELVNLLGPDKVYLSLYENDAGEKAQAAMDRFKDKLNCKFSLSRQVQRYTNLPNRQQDHPPRAL